MFSCRRKEETDGADCTSSGRVFQKMETSNGRLLTDGTVGLAAAVWTTAAGNNLLGYIPEQVGSETVASNLPRECLAIYAGMYVSMSKQ